MSLIQLEKGSLDVNKYLKKKKYFLQNLMSVILLGILTIING